MDISIVILNYKSRGLTLNCIKSIKEADFRNLKYEIIVVDNSSDEYIKDILAWQFPKVLYLKNEKNIGMGAGNNVGIKKSSGKYIVIMNPDTISFKDTFIKLYYYMEENPDIGVAGPKQYNPDKTVQDSCFRWYGFLTPIYRRTFLGRLGFAKKSIDFFLFKDYDRKSPREVDWLLGSFLFCRAEALNNSNFFDERYFLYFEDTDLCRKFWNKNWKVAYVPEAEIIHNHNRESANLPWYKFFLNKASRHHFTSWIKYTLKWKVINK